jgi:precorrin-6A/cobalt-precorrin-6A reductase
MRVGGFGGVAGLKTWLSENRTDCVIDATHPFAAFISRNAARACDELDIPIVALHRPAWSKTDGDQWIKVADMDRAVSALGERSRRIFLTIGRLEIAAFAAAPQHHYLVRTIEPVGDALPVPHVTAIEARGPFEEDAEVDLLRQHRIEILVSKNSGGPPTYAKIAAARRLGVPVVMIARPESPDVTAVGSVDEALAWLARHRPPP